MSVRVDLTVAEAQLVVSLVRGVLGAGEGGGIITPGYERRARLAHNVKTQLEAELRRVGGVR